MNSLVHKETHTLSRRYILLKENAVLTFISFVVVSVFGFHLLITTRALEALPTSGYGPGNYFLRSKVALEDRDTDVKYLEYFVQAGWSNQMVCLKNAYEIALATGRGLVLSPVVPHFAFYMNNVMNINTLEFKLRYNLKNTYLRKLSPINYIPLGNVLDLETSLPGLVSKVDFQDFCRNNAHANVHPWALEANATHFNTHWIRNQSAADGSQEEIDMTEHQVHLRYNRTFRDILGFSETSPFREYPVWTLLDSYHVALHESVFRDGRKSSFRPRFQSKILEASRAVWRDR
mmetsp:Transcript_5390/g.12794  ORF Transcript_5390/g.12794 Transcript_5390/m.12794 type:complete len:290 (+) Transcript_5390:216-1085(+)